MRAQNEYQKEIIDEAQHEIGKRWKITYRNQRKDPGFWSLEPKLKKYIAEFEEEDDTID